MQRKSHHHILGRPSRPPGAWPTPSMVHVTTASTVVPHELSAEPDQADMLAMHQGTAKQFAAAGCKKLPTPTGIAALLTMSVCGHIPPGGLDDFSMDEPSLALRMSPGSAAVHRTVLEDSGCSTSSRDTNQPMMLDVSEMQSLQGSVWLYHGDSQSSSDLQSSMGNAIRFAWKRL